MRSLTATRPCPWFALRLLWGQTFALFAFGDTPAQGAARTTLSLDGAWQFALKTEGESQVAAPALAWREVQVPHDWAWEAGPRNGGAQGERGGYRLGGVGWYQKTFTLPASMQGRRVVLQFDGVYRNATVYLNQTALGTRPYGYLSFEYEITRVVREGVNTVMVRVDNSLEPSARWHHPCGIYGSVRLEASHPEARLVRDSIFITTPSVSSELATVQVAAEIHGERAKRLELEVTGPDGHPVGRWELAAGTRVEHTFTVRDPQRWGPGSPSLYRATLSLFTDDPDGPADILRVPFGIRSLAWDAQRGFFLNGQPFKIIGMCEHLTGGPVGGAWSPTLLEWKLRLLQSMGVNAVRTAHNPALPMFYELCDRLGLLVMNEAFDGWKRKAEFDYGALHFDEWWERDLSDFIRRDRNHPSVILWSVGNETDGAIAEALVAHCHELDPTRLVSSGAAGTEAMDIIGINGFSERLSFFSEGPFERPFIASEAPHTWQVRGFYKTKTWYRNGFPNEHQDPFPIPDLEPEEIFTSALMPAAEQANPKQVFNSSYDNATVRINNRQHWEKVRDLDWISGFFRWTGFDYPGEAGFVHGGWPFHSFMGGALDLAGFPKDLFFFYQSQWTQAPVLHLLPHWTHPRMPEGTLIPVHAYTNAAEVELFLNGKSLGVERPGTAWDEMQCEWRVPWRPGELTVVGRDEKGREVTRQVMRTAGPPARIEGTTEDLGGGTALVTLSTVDAQGVLYPYGENRLFVSVPPSVRIRAFENGHPADCDPPVASDRRAFMGLARIFLEFSHGSDTPAPMLTVGAILGERRQLTSDRVHIDLRHFDLGGTEARGGAERIHYTTDGSEPTRESPRYADPFAVPAEATVKAVVYRGADAILRLEESFGPDRGLHWETP